VNSIIETTNRSFREAFLAKLNDYKLLIKLNLSLMVVFSSIVGYWAAPQTSFNLINFVLLFLGGLLVTGAANACNEIIEQHTDLLMKRTADRPIPAGRMSNMEAGIFAFVALFCGLALLWMQFNLLSAFISLVSFVLYVLVYTPLKKVSPINVFVGAIPGALPCLIGWSAATGSLSLGGWSLFILQFIWQFPHFWAIAWVAFDDYKKAGLKMLPTENKESNYTSIQCVYYTVALLLCSGLPFMTNVTGIWAVALIAVAAIWFLYKAILFYQDNSDIRAKGLMFASFIYLPLVYLAFFINKL
jgi:heme o synthase